MPIFASGWANINASPFSCGQARGGDDDELVDELDDDGGGGSPLPRAPLRISQIDCITCW